jgi:hypothetical protein
MKTRNEMKWNEVCRHIIDHLQEELYLCKLFSHRGLWLAITCFKFELRIISIIPISIQVLIPDLIFPVYKIDREQSWKNVSKEHLKIPKRYSEAVVFENSNFKIVAIFLFFPIWIWRIIVSFWYYMHIKTQVNRNFRTSTFLLFLVFRW